VEYPKEGAGMNWRWAAFIAAMCALAGGIAAWVLHASVVDHWAAVHTGTINEPGPYYGFWSGFGSDLTELGIIGAIGTGVYQLFKKYNCHEPRCWRVGTHEMAGGQFHVCYRHHPDYNGARPTHELMVRLHEEHAQVQAALHETRQHATEKIGDEAHASATSEMP
jgi:hypothetical protein